MKNKELIICINRLFSKLNQTKDKEVKDYINSIERHQVYQLMIMVNSVSLNCDKNTNMAVHEIAH